MNLLRRHVILKSQTLKHNVRGESVLYTTREEAERHIELFVTKPRQGLYSVTDALVVCNVRGEHMRILSVDPGERAGWAIFLETSMIASGVINGDDQVAIRDLLTEFSPDWVVVEDQFLGKHKRKGRTVQSSFKGLKTLMRRRHVWEFTAGALGIDFATVYPQSWQAYYRLRKLRFETDKGWKERICRMAENYAKGKRVELDEGDAILIGNYFAVKKQEERLYNG